MWLCSGEQYAEILFVSVHVRHSKISFQSKVEPAGLFSRDAAVNQNTVNLYLKTGCAGFS